MRRSPRDGSAAGAGSSGATPTGKRGRGIFDNPDDFTFEGSDDEDDERRDMLKEILRSDDEESDGDDDGDDGRGRELATNVKGKRVVVTKRFRQKTVVNSRAMLHVTHNFENWDNAKNPTNKKIELTEEWKELFAQAKADRHSVCCARCLWSVKHENISTTQGMLMHLLCPSCYEGKPNEVTKFGWLSALPRPMWKKFVNTAVLKWERQVDPLEDDATYFFEEVRAAAGHKDEFKTWFDQWCVKETPKSRVNFSNMRTPGLKVAAGGKGDRSGIDAAGDDDEEVAAGPAEHDKMLAVIAHFDVIIAVVADAIASGNAGTAAGSTEAQMGLKGAAEHVLENKLLTHVLVKFDPAGAPCALGPKGFFLFMGAPGKKLGAVDQYVKSAAAVQKYHPSETKLALSVLRAKRAELEVRRVNLVDAARSRETAAVKRAGFIAEEAPMRELVMKDAAVRYQEVDLECANAPSAVGKAPGQVVQQVGKDRTFVKVRGLDTAMLRLDVSNGPVTPFLAVRLQVPAAVSGNAALTKHIDGKAHYMVHTFPSPGGWTPPMKAVMKSGSLPSSRVLMSGRTVMSALGFVSSVQELAACSVAVFTEDERWTVGLSYIAEDLSTRLQQNLSRTIMMQAWDDTVDSVIKDATGIIARELQKVVNAEEQVDNFVSREIYLLPDLWSKWQSQLQLEMSVSAREKQRDDEYDRRERERDRVVKQQQAAYQKIQQQVQFKAPVATFVQKALPREARRSASPSGGREREQRKFGGERWDERYDGRRGGRGDRDRDRGRKSEARRARSETRSRSRSPPPREEKAEKKPAGGAGRGDKPGEQREKVVVQKKPAQAAGGVGVPAKINKLCTFHFSDRGCNFSEANCRFYHSKASLPKH